MCTTPSKLNQSCNTWGTTTEKGATLGVVSVVLTPTTGYTSSITTPTYPNSTLPPRLKREGKARANSVFGDFFSMRSIFGDPVVFWEEDRDLTLKQEEGLKTVCFMCP